MKRCFVIALVLCSLGIACKSTKNTAATTASSDPSKLNGTWELNYIAGSSMDFKDLYPNKKPMITFQVAEGKVNGNTGCNTFLGSLNVNGSKIDFTDPLALSRMACPGDGESTFLETLKKVNTYNVNGKTLNFIMGDVAVMRFEKK